MKETVKVLLVLFLALGGSSLYAASPNYIKDAKKEFDAGEYEKAGIYYNIAYVEDGINTDREQKLCKDCHRFQLFAREMVKMDDKEKAVTYYEKLLELNPNDKEALEFVERFNPKNGRVNDKYSSNHIVTVYMNDGKKLNFYSDPHLSEMTYREAVEFCSRLNVDGLRGWRLPTMDELVSYFGDYPSDKGKYFWVGYKGVIVNGRQADYYEQNTNMRYSPCIDGSSLLVHPYKVNSRNEIVSGIVERHRLIPVRTVE